MSDKELLELAAKAEGHAVEYDELSGLYWFDTKFTGLLWNPLHNDGDALRLAVTMYFAVSVCSDYTVILGCGIRENHNDNPCAATRRAIVRAAAEIGKELP